MSKPFKKPIGNKLNVKAPDSAFSFQAGESVFEFAEKQEGQPRRFKLKLYDGGVSEHWYWGKLAFDLAGMKLEKTKIPILFGHDTNIRIGVADKATFDGAFILEGYALDNEDAQKVLDDADQGFPFESSLKFDRFKSKYRFVRDGENTTINSKKLQGPGTVFTNTIVKEGSVCVFGALNNCKTEAFEHEREELERKQAMLTIEELKEQHPELYKQVFEAGTEDGRKLTRQQFTDIAAACGNDHELTVKAFSENKSAADALKMRCDKQAEELKARDETIAKLQAKKKDEEEQADDGDETEQEEVETAESEFSDDVAKNKNAGKKPGSKTTDFTAMTETQLKEAWDRDAKLQNEFIEADDFVAFIKAQKDGKVEIFENKK